MYEEERLSTSEIAKHFCCSINKINYWLAKFNISKRSIAEAIYTKRNPKGDPFKFKGINTLEDAKLFGLGMGLYWGEGSKKSKNTIRLGNTDPRLIKRFLDFLVTLFAINKSKLRFGLQIFSDIKPESALKFWENELKEFGASRKQFFRPTITPYRGVGNYKEKSRYGVLTIHFSNSKLKKLFDSLLPL